MANATALLAVQATVYQLLSGAAPLTALASVYDLVTEGKSYPYVEIGEFEETVVNTYGKNGRSVLASLHVYSDAAGYLESEKILEQLNLLLDRQPDNTGALPDPTGWKCWDNSYEIGTLQKEFDVAELRHLIVRYRIEVTQP